MNENIKLKSNKKNALEFLREHWDEEIWGLGDMVILETKESQNGSKEQTND